MKDSTFSQVLFLIFLTLKLTGVIDWSWWWVTAPLWGAVAVILVCGVIGFTFAAIKDARKSKQ